MRKNHPFPSQAETDGSMSIEIEYEHVDDTADFHAKMQIPASIGSSICIDFPAHEDADVKDLM